MNMNLARAAIFATVTLVFLAFSLRISASSPLAQALPKSGTAYASAEIRALQADDASNPGMLWVANGETLWNAVADGQAKSCAQCHGAASVSMKAVATRYPQMIPTAAVPTLINLEGRINLCRVKHQRTTPLAYESPDLLALSTFVSHQSRGLVRRLTINHGNRAYYQRGGAFYQQRMGQMNLACTHCHDQNAGKTLLAEKISEGHPNGYPIYRLEWQGVGSLHRRFRSCLSGIRAEPFVPGGDEYLSLELYLAIRAFGLEFETPAVRR